MKFMTSSLNRAIVEFASILTCRRLHFLCWWYTPNRSIWLSCCRAQLYNPNGMNGYKWDIASLCLIYSTASSMNHVCSAMKPMNFNVSVTLINDVTFYSEYSELTAIEKPSLHLDRKLIATNHFSQRFSVMSRGMLFCQNWTEFWSEWTVYVDEEDSFRVHTGVMR